MAVDVDLVTPGKQSVVYQGGTAWNVTFISSVICALLALALILWYFASNASLQKQVTDLGASAAAKDQQITAANALPATTLRPATTVEQRAGDLVTTVNTFQKLLDTRQVWSRVLPLISAHTLQGISLTGMSVDDKLAIKIDGVSHATVLGSDQVTPYGLIARQVVAFRDATDESLTVSVTTQAQGTTAKTPVNSKAFSNVTLSSISESATPGSTAGTNVQTGHFSISVTLNPLLLKDKATATTTTSKTAP